MWYNDGEYDCHNYHLLHTGNLQRLWVFYMSNPALRNDILHLAYTKSSPWTNSNALWFKWYWICSSRSDLLKSITWSDDHPIQLFIYATPRQCELRDKDVSWMKMHFDQQRISPPFNIATAFISLWNMLSNNFSIVHTISFKTSTVILEYIIHIKN